MYLFLLPTLYNSRLWQVMVQRFQCTSHLHHRVLKPWAFVIAKALVSLSCSSSRLFFLIGVAHHMEVFEDGRSVNCEFRNVSVFALFLGVDVRACFVNARDCRDIVVTLFHQTNRQLIWRLDWVWSASLTIYWTLIDAFFSLQFWDFPIFDTQELLHSFHLLLHHVHFSF